MSLWWGPDPADSSLTNPGLLLSYCVRQFRSISQSLIGMVVEHVVFSVHDMEPRKPREGMVVMADGTNWNPGSGVGLYRYTGGSWVKIG